MSLATLSDDRPVDPDDEQLVAYLDGELDANARGDLEQRLLDDEQLRTRLQALQQGWDWLDALPSTTPSEKLVETTLELVVADIVKPKSSVGLKAKAWRKPIAVLMASVLLAAAVVGLIQFQRSIDYRRQLDELAIAENVDAYSKADDLDLMRDLSRNQQWTQMIAVAREAKLIPAAPDHSIASIPISARSAAIGELSPTARQTLANQWDRFNRLPPETKRAVEQVHQEVALQSDATTLLRTMRNYAAWKETLTPQLADKIERRGDAVDDEESIETRDAAMEQAVSQTIRDATLLTRRKLDEATIEPINEALEEILDLRIAMQSDPAILKLLSDREEGGEKVIEESASQPETLRQRVIFQLTQSNSRPSFWRRMPGMQGPNWDRATLDAIAPLTEYELDMIEFFLPAADQDTLRQLSMYKYEFLQGWAEEAALRSLMSSLGWDRNDETMLQRYEGIPAEMRDRLDLADPESAMEELSRNRSRRYPGRRPGPGPPN